MIHFLYSYIVLYWRWIIVTVLLLAIIGLGMWLVCSYYVLKWLKMNIDKDCFYFTDYNSDCWKILENYGDYPIKRIYLVRQPIRKSIKLFLNIITLYKFDREMNKYIESTDNPICFPYHSSLIIEVELPDRTQKKILIEKNNCIKFALNFRVYDNQVIRKLPLAKKNYTLKQIMKVTKERIGNNKFFNWQVTRNNCQIFVKDILITLGKFTKKRKEFIFQEEFFRYIQFSDFSIHTIYTIANLINMFEGIVGIKFF